MKKFILIILLSFFSGVASIAQIKYMPTYNRSIDATTETTDNYTTPHSYQQQAQPQVQTIRTTAYVQKGDNIYKVPIKVQIQGNNARVIERYVNNGLEGQWERVYNGGYVSKCSSAINQNSLESMFMYKAFVDLSDYYFDL